MRMVLVSYRWYKICAYFCLKNRHSGDEPPTTCCLLFIDSLLYFTVMISISKANVPDYLVGSNLYNALSSDDTEEFSIPDGNLKLTLVLADVDDLRHLMNTLRFWGADKYPDELLLYLLGSRSEDGRREVLSVLNEFSIFPELIQWYDNLPEVESLDTSRSGFRGLPFVGVGSIPTFIKCLTSNNESIILQALTHLQRLADFSLSTKCFLASQLYVIINSVSPIESLPLVNQRHIAQFVGERYYNCTACSMDTFVSILPFVITYLNSNDEEFISCGCQLLVSSEKHAGVIVDHNIVPRLVTLLSHPSHTIQADAVRIVSSIVTEGNIFAQTIMEEKILEALGTILQDSTRPKETHYMVYRTFRTCILLILHYHYHSNIDAVAGKLLLNVVISALSDVVKNGEIAELRHLCSCLIVFAHCHCFDENPASEFNRGWKVCKEMGMIKKALKDPWLRGVSKTYLPP